MDKEILLAFINNQGTGFSWIVVAFFVMVVALVGVAAARKNDYQEGKNAARREGLENLNASIARLVHDQQQLKDMFQDPMSTSRTPITPSPTTSTEPHP